MIGSGTRVPLVHDQETIPLSLATYLKRERFHVIHAHDAVQALCAMPCRHFDVVVTDSELPEFTGLNLLKRQES
jgi:DNA-binding NtrC family response regulator